MLGPGKGTEQEAAGTDMTKMTEQEAKEMGEAVLRMLKESGEVWKPIMAIVLSCPNVVIRSQVMRHRPASIP